MGDSWKIDFRKPLGKINMIEWERLVRLLDGYQDIIMSKTNIVGSLRSQEDILQDQCIEG